MAYKTPFSTRYAAKKYLFRYFSLMVSSCRGQIESFDQFVILLKNTVSQIVYKHGISTVVPARNVAISESDAQPFAIAGCSTTAGEWATAPLSRKPQISLASITLKKAGSIALWSDEVER